MILIIGIEIDQSTSNTQYQVILSNLGGSAGWGCIDLHADDITKAFCSSHNHATFFIHNKHSSPAVLYVVSIRSVKYIGHEEKKVVTNILVNTL
jgi:hypothetical protein